MARQFLRAAGVAGVAVAMTAMVTAAASGGTPAASHNPGTATPIKHVIVIIGENHSFDNVFASLHHASRRAGGGRSRFGRVGS